MHLEQAQHPRPAADDRQHDDAEGLLQLRVLVEVVEDDLADFAALQLDDHAHAVAIRLVAEVGDALDRLLADQVGDALEQLRLVHLVRDLGDDDLLRGRPSWSVSISALARTWMRAAAGDVGLVNAATADDDAAGREVRARDERESAP